MVCCTSPGRAPRRQRAVRLPPTPPVPGLQERSVKTINRHPFFQMRGRTVAFQVSYLIRFQHDNLEVRVRLAPCAIERHAEGRAGHTLHLAQAR